MMFDPPMSNKSFWSATIVAAVLMGLLFFWIAHSERAVRIHNDQQWSAFAAHATTEDQRLLVQYFKNKCADPRSATLSPSTADDIRTRCISVHAAELGVRAIPKPALSADLRALGVIPSP